MWDWPELPNRGADLTFGRRQLLQSRDQLIIGRGGAVILDRDDRKR